VDLRGGFVRAAVGPRRRILVTMDWTDFDADDQTVLCLSLVTRSKRALPLVWTTERKSELKGHRGTHEKTALQMLRLALPVGTEVVVLADRGFGYTELFDHLLGIPGFRFVVRFRANIIVAAGATRDKAGALVPGNGRVRVLGSAKLTAAGRGPYTVVLYKARGMKDSWCLATDLPTADGRDIVERYARRFECEEAFRDIKDRRYGLGLKYTSIDCPRRRERLLFAVAIAYFILTLAGVASERLGIDRILKANTVRRRTHSLFRQGREILGGELPHDYGAAFARLFMRLVTLAISGGFAHALA
jgi:hypothetical protein